MVTKQHVLWPRQCIVPSSGKTAATPAQHCVEATLGPRAAGPLREPAGRSSRIATCKIRLCWSGSDAGTVPGWAGSIKHLWAGTGPPRAPPGSYSCDRKSRNKTSLTPM